MNYLAHLLLSGPDPDIQIGGLLGDFVKGPALEGYPAAIAFGIRLHRRLDTLTDQTQAFRTARAELPGEWRRFGGILLDIYFDHLLARQWSDHHGQALPTFCHTFYRHLTSRYELLPAGARYFCDRAPQTAWLESYADPRAVPVMLDRVGARLRRPVALGEAWPVLQKLGPQLQQSFDELMPLLRQHANEERMRFAARS